MKGLLLCEGGTEQRYFMDMEQHLVMRGKLTDVEIEIYQPKDHSPTGLLREARRRVKQAAEAEQSFGFIWLIFDKDDHPGVATTFHEALLWKGTPDIKIAFSAMCFEYYLLLHFERTTKPFRNGAEAVRHLRRHVPDYEKTTSLYDQLYSRKYDAFQNSTFLMKHNQNELLRGRRPYELSAYTNVHELEMFLECI